MKIALDNEVPYFIRVHDFPCRAWNAGQPPQCSICRKFGHRASDCPLSQVCAGVVISPPPQPRLLCSAPAVSTSSSSVSASPAKVSAPVSVSTSSSSASVSPALVSAVSTPPSSASVPASPDVSSSVPAVPASSAVTSDSKPVTSDAPSSVPVSRSSAVAHRDKIDSYLLSALGDFSRDDVVRMFPARVTDFVSHVIEKNDLSIDSHQYMARFVYHVKRKFCVQLQTGKKPMTEASSS